VNHCRPRQGRTRLCRREGLDMRDRNVEIRRMLLACLVGLMAGIARAEGPRILFRVTTRKAEDRVLARLQGDRAVLTVTSPSGIGGATITREGERWSGEMVLRLRFRGLERLQVGNAKVTLSATVSSGGDHRTSWSRSEGVKEEFPIDRSSPFWAEIRILDAQAISPGTSPSKTVCSRSPFPRPSSHRTRRRSRWTGSTSTAEEVARPGLDS
jgi:hypothetical protein